MLSCCYPETHRPWVRLLGVDRSQFDQVPMIKEEYEKEYNAAIDSMERLGHRVGSSSVSLYGVRWVRVDSFPWMDDAVFEEVWGKEKAAAIAIAETA